MAEELPSLHIDNDWKKQAQEEKRRLVEQEQKRQEQERAARAAPPTISPEPAMAGAGPASAGRGGREAPQANFNTLVQSHWTQAMLYLGELAMSGMEPVVDLDRAKHQLDMLGVIEDKTKGNLAEDEQRLLDGALYETRARYINVASQYI
jgi:hypothetical protein